MATIDPEAAAKRRKAQRANARAMKKGGTNPISGMAAKAAKTVATRSGPKTSETAHLSGQQFSIGGKHHAPASQGAKKNAYGSTDAPARGRHVTRAETGPKHRSGNTPDSNPSSKMRDLKGAIRDRQGTGRVGKHRKPGA